MDPVVLLRVNMALRRIMYAVCDVYRKALVPYSHRRSQGVQWVHMHP